MYHVHPDQAAVVAHAQLSELRRQADRGRLYREAKRLNADERSRHRSPPRRQRQR